MNAVCAAQIVEVIREHRFYEKTFVVETRPAGERELTDRQRVSSASLLICRCRWELPERSLADAYGHPSLPFING